MKWCIKNKKIRQQCRCRTPLMYRMIVKLHIKNKKIKQPTQQTINQNNRPDQETTVSDVQMRNPTDGWTRMIVKKHL